MKRIFTTYLVFLYSIVLNAQGVLPGVISKDLPPEYKYTEWRVLSSENEKTIEGIVTFSLPQNNKCFGGDSAYITVSYTYFSKSSVPTAAEIAKKNETFDKGARENYKKVVENISLGMFNTHDKEYIDCSELSFINHEQVNYYHYSTKIKCKGYANGVTNEIMEQKVIEYHYDLPDNVKKQLINDFQYSNTYITARADKDLNKKDVSITLYGTITYDEAFFHTKLLMHHFLNFNYENISKAK